MFSGNSMPFTMDVVPAGSNNCGGMGGWGGDWIWIILVFALIWGNNGFGGGFGGNCLQGALTRGDLCQDMNFNDLQNAVRSSAAENNANFRGVDNAVCQLGYQNAQLINGVERAVDGGFARLDTSLCQSVNNISQQLNGINVSNLQSANALQAQIAGCCCDVREGIQGVNYNLATQANGLSREVERGFNQTNFNMQQQNCATLQAIDKVGDRVIDYLTNQEAQRLRDENFMYKLSASQAEQNNYLVNKLRPCPIPAYQTCNPWASTNNCFCNS